MIRIGFILGFLVGGGIASMLAQSATEEDEAGNPVVGGARGQLRQVRETAKEAQLEKEAEMLRLHDDMVHRRVPPEQNEP